MRDDDTRPGTDAGPEFDVPYFHSVETSRPTRLDLDPDAAEQLWEMYRQTNRPPERFDVFAFNYANSEICVTVDGEPIDQFVDEQVSGEADS